MQICGNNVIASKLVSIDTASPMAINQGLGWIHKLSEKKVERYLLFLCLKLNYGRRIRL